MSNEINRLRLENLVLRDSLRMATITFERVETELRDILQAGYGARSTRDVLEIVQKANLKLTVPPTWFDEPTPPGAA